MHELNLQVTSPLLDRLHRWSASVRRELEACGGVVWEHLRAKRKGCGFLVFFNQTKTYFWKTSNTSASRLKESHRVLENRPCLRCNKWADSTTPSWVSAAPDRTVNSLRGQCWWGRAAVTTQEVAKLSATFYNRQSEVLTLLISVLFVGVFLTLLQRRPFSWKQIDNATLHCKK